MDYLEKIRNDLRFVLGWFPLECLEHVRANRHRLIRKQYTDGEGGCLFYLLSERFPTPLRIDSKAALTRFFTGRSGYPACETPEYQPARWLVRIIDGEAVERYGGASYLDWDVVIEVIDAVIAERQIRHAEEEVVRTTALRRLASVARGKLERTG
jgi:hypothetical protein